MSPSVRPSLMRLAAVLAAALLQACTHRAVAPTSPAAELRNTAWKLVELDGAPAPAAAQQAREVRITLQAEGGRVIGFSGCNRLMGGYVNDGPALRFTTLAGTRMACEPGLMALEDRVLKMLGRVTAQRIEGPQLLLLAGPQVLARFEAVYLR